MPRFVILEHDHPTLHWDLMLDTGPALRTWRLAAPPTTGEIVAAEPLADHRLVYLDYEGPISGERGNVRRWDAGSFCDFAEHDSAVEFLLEGGRVRGRVRLTYSGGSQWRLALIACDTDEP